MAPITISMVAERRSCAALFARADSTDTTGTKAGISSAGSAFSFHEIEKYADDNAGDLSEMAFREKGTGRLSLTLE
jgi:hypothetical protein